MNKSVDVCAVADFTSRSVEVFSVKIMYSPIES